jgi:hypothetical protein
LTFTARTTAIEEPAFRGTMGDYTRFTQFGSWQGTFAVDGATTTVDATFRGVRDRSWGRRSVGQPIPAAPSLADRSAFWLWAPINFDDVCTHLDSMEGPDGRPWHRSGFIVSVPPAVHSPVDGGADDIDVMLGIDHQITWQPGTRWAQFATLHLQHVDGSVDTIELEPLMRFQMGSIGYFDPKYGHGVWHGEEVVVSRRTRASDVDPSMPTAWHVQHLCRAAWGDRRGLGVLEHVAFGTHLPSGFRS